MASKSTDSRRDLRVEHLMSTDLGDFNPQRQDVSQSTNNRRTTTRSSRFQSKAWNRQRIQIFADFNAFDGSRSQRAAEQNDEQLENQETIPPLEIGRTKIFRQEHIRFGQAITGTALQYLYTCKEETTCLYDISGGHFQPIYRRMSTFQPWARSQRCFAGYR